MALRWPRRRKAITVGSITGYVTLDVPPALVKYQSAVTLRDILDQVTAQAEEAKLFHAQMLELAARPAEVNFDAKALARIVRKGNGELGRTS